MSDLNLDNYEAYLLDYAEGRLGTEEIAALQQFLLSHPELEIDLAELSLPQLDQSTAVFENPGQLLKDIPDPGDIKVLEYLEGLLDAEQSKAFEASVLRDPQLKDRLNLFRHVKFVTDPAVFEKLLLFKDRATDIEERVLEYEEGLMSAKEQMVFEQEMRTLPELAAIQQAYRSCVLQPDADAVFPGKEILYKSGRVLPLFSLRVLARMAAAILLIVSMVVLFWPSDPDQRTISSLPVKPRPETSAAPLPVEPMGSATTLNTNTPDAEPVAVVRPSRPAPAVSQEQKEPQVVRIDSAVTSHAPETLVAHAIPDSAKNNKNEKPMTAREPVKVVSDLELLAFAEDEEAAADSSGRRNFWKRVVNVATQFSRLGVKGLDAEKENESYRLSINAFMVEKKFSRL